jgi:hypothetical protein
MYLVGMLTKTCCPEVENHVERSTRDCVGKHFLLNRLSEQTPFTCLKVATSASTLHYYNVNNNNNVNSPKIITPVNQNCRNNRIPIPRC